MPHELSQYDHELPDINDAFAGDTRTLAFRVVDADGNGVDITNATIAWALFAREYQDDTADAVIDDGDGDVTITTSGTVDPSVGEFEVELAAAATDTLWGVYYHRPEVTQSDGTVVSWRGRLTIEA